MRILKSRRVVILSAGALWADSCLSKKMESKNLFPARKTARFLDSKARRDKIASRSRLSTRNDKPLSIKKFSCDCPVIPLCETRFEACRKLYFSECVI